MSGSLASRMLRYILNLIMILFSFTCVFPIIWMIYSSLKTQKEFGLNIISLPANPHIGNYILAFKEGKMLMYLFNSLFVSIVSVILIIILGYVTGYFLARYNFRGRNILYVMFLAGMLIPVYGLLVPIFVQFNYFHMLDKRFTLIIPYVAFGMPLAVFLIESFVKTIPTEMEEAAIIDGASITHILFSIIMPLCRPVLATTFVLSFLNRWNEFPFALVLIKSDYLKTIPVGLTNFYGENTVDYTRLMAGLVISTLPVILAYLGFSKNIIQGMTAGAVKG